MVAVEEFVAHLSRKGVRLWIESGRIRYRAGKGLLTDRERDEIAARKAAILELLDKNASGVEPPSIPRRCAETRVPLSFAQERLWFVDQLNPEAEGAYHLGTMLKIEGELDVLALRRALDRIVSRHEALRTVFVREGEQAVQVIVPQASFSLVEKDFSALEMPERTRELEREIQKESQRRFDLSSGPLIRGLLLRQGPQEHLLVLSMHHIVADGWSISVLMKELSMLYAAYCKEEGEPLPDLPVQYADYTLWQRQRL